MPVVSGLVRGLGLNLAVPVLWLSIHSIGTAGADAYTAAKGGVLTLTKSLALQWADKKIRVNAIAPGVVLSERVRGLVSTDDPIYKKSILGPSEPEDVAPLALFLASDESKQITGAIMPMDSGASAI